MKSLFKTIKIFNYIFILIVVCYCKKEDPIPTNSNTQPTYKYGKNKGKLVVYAKGDCSDGQIDVYRDGTKLGTLTSFYTNSTPSCSDENVTLSEILSVGTYKIKANTTGGRYIWPDYSFTITENECTFIPYGCTTGNPNTTPSNSSTRTVSFWNRTGSGYGTVKVTLSTYTSSITTDYSSSPTCGSIGVANFYNMPNSTLYYAAYEVGGNATWSGSVPSSSTNCYIVELY